MPKSNERNSFIFYRSFWEVVNDFFDEAEVDKIKARADADRLELEWYRGINRFAFSAIEPFFKDRVLRIAWQNVFPVIYKSNQLYKNGLLGGRPTETKPNGNQTETKSKPNGNQTETKSKPNGNQTETKSKPDISSSSNNSTMKEREPELEPEPNPELEPEPKPEQEREKKSHTVFLSQILSIFPKMKTDNVVLPDNFDGDKVIFAIQESDFLQKTKTTKLKWYVDNYEAVVSGEYKDFKKSKRPKGGQNWTSSQLNDLYDDVDNLEV